MRHRLVGALALLALVSCRQERTFPPLRGLALGWGHSLAITADGTLLAWGENSEGQLGICDVHNRLLAELVDPTDEPVDLPWLDVAGGSRHTCAIAEDGSMWCWGTNVHGQLGLGNTINQTMPTRVGVDDDFVQVTLGGLHTCALRANGTLWCWGANPAGQLGLGESTAEEHAPRQVGTDTTWTHIVARARFVCGLHQDHSLWCWGDDSNGQIGIDSVVDQRTPQRVGAERSWVAVGTGTRHACAIDTDGALYCWGANDVGQLGLGDTVDRHVPVRVGSEVGWAFVAAGFSHTCALRTDRSLWCWGDDVSGQLGLDESPSPHATPTRVGADDDWLSLAVGADHSCAQRTDGTLWCWGSGEYGQLGLGDATDNPFPALVPLGL